MLPLFKRGILSGLPLCKRGILSGLPLCKRGIEGDFLRSIRFVFYERSEAVTEGKLNRKHD